MFCVISPKVPVRRFSDLIRDGDKSFLCIFRPMRRFFLSARESEKTEGGMYENPKEHKYDDNDECRPGHAAILLR